MKFFKFGTKNVSRNWKPTYLVEVKDKYFGIMYCSVDEAFTSADLDDSNSLRPYSQASLIPISEACVPGKIYRQLMKVVADLDIEE